MIKRCLFLFILVMVLGGCANKDFTSPILLAGEGEDWAVEMVIQQEKNGDTYHSRYGYNFTYKKDDEKYIQKWIEGEEVTLTYDIEGLFEEGPPQTPMFYGNQGYWKTGVTNKSISKPYTKEDEFEMVLKLDGKKETFALSFDEERTEDLENIEGDVIENSLQEPVGDQG